MFSSIFAKAKPVQSTAQTFTGFLRIFKDSEASTKAWLSRERAKAHEAKHKAAISNPRQVPTAGDYKGWIPIVHAPGQGWVREDGKKLTEDNKKLLAQAVTPPGWSNVLLNPHPTDGANITRGMDAKGKYQVKQRPETAQANAAAKWERVRDFHKVGMKPIVRQAERDMVDATKSPQERDLGAVIHLVARTGFRIGSDTDTGAAEQAYGASTLQKKHIKLKAGSKIGFEFVGKKGVTITKTVQDKQLHDYLSERLKSLKSDETVFNASNTQALAFIKKASGDDRFKTKDFRTWNGTAIALALRKSLPKPTSEKEWKDTQKLIAETVADHLGNTPDVALNSYIAPYIFDKWDQKFKPSPKAKKAEDTQDDFWDGATSGDMFPYQEMWDAMEEEVPSEEPVKKASLASVFKDSEASTKAWVTRAKRTPTDLDERLVDYKPDRSLEGPGTSKIRDMLPEVEHVAYSKTPFIETMHKLMGVTDPMTHDIGDYMKKRDRLFDKQPVKTAPYDKVVVTQARVNDARVQQLVDDPSTGGTKPVQTVRHGGMTYIMNGHHRVVAEMKSGAKEVQSKVLDLTDAKKEESSAPEEKKSPSGLGFVFKDSAASAKAWLKRKRMFVSTGTKEQALSINDSLGQQYYAAREKYGKDDPKTVAAYGEWQKSKDTLMSEHVFSKDKVGDLSLSSKKNYEASQLNKSKPAKTQAESDAADKAEYKKNALQSLTDSVKSYGLGSQEYKDWVEASKKYGATDDDIKKAVGSAATFHSAKPKPGDYGTSTSPVKMKAKLLQAHLAVLGGVGSKQDLQDAISAAEAVGLTKGQMAAMKAHATMAHKKNMAFVGTAKPSLKTPAFTDSSSGYEGYLDASKDSDVYAKAQKIGADVYGNMSWEQQKATTSWIGAGYSTMNKVMNGVHVPDHEYEEAKQNLKHLKDALNHEIGVPLKLRRNMAQKWFMKSFGLPHESREAMWNIPEADIQALVGKKYTEKAPSSTTYNTKSGIGFTNTASDSGGMALMIKAPKESKGIFVDGFKVSGESEVLLQSGTTYIIEKIVKAAQKPAYGKDPMYQVHVRIIGSDGS